MVWGKQLAHSAHSGARPPHQLSRQVSQEDKGPLPQLPRPPPSPAIRLWGGEGDPEPPSGPGSGSRPGPVVLSGPRVQPEDLGGEESHLDPPGPVAENRKIPLNRRISGPPNVKASRTTPEVKDHGPTLRHTQPAPQTQGSEDHDP